jgi:hypothetical protein
MVHFIDDGSYNNHSIIAGASTSKIRYNMVQNPMKYITIERKKIFFQLQVVVDRFNSSTFSYVRERRREHGYL